MKVDLRTRIMLWLRADWLLILISITAAVMIFFAVRENISYTETRLVTVEVEREAGIALMAVRPANVRITFRGSLNELRQLSRREPQVIVRAPRADPTDGTVRIRLRSRHVRGVTGLRVVSIEPTEVSLNFDHQGERLLAVATPIIEGRPLRGRAEIEDYTPRSVLVRGARLQLDNLHEQGIRLQPNPINVDGRVQGFSVRAPLIPPPDAWMPELTPPEVTVKVAIVPENAEREFAGVPVMLATASRPLPADLRIEPDTVTVRLIGWSEELRRIPTNAVHVYVDCPDTPLTATTNAWPLHVLLPAGMVIDSATTDPPAVFLRGTAPDTTEP